jgi:hypothetical protein
MVTSINDYCFGLTEIESQKKLVYLLPYRKKRHDNNHPKLH